MTTSLKKSISLLQTLNLSLPLPASRNMDKPIPTHTEKNSNNSPAHYASILFLSNRSLWIFLYSFPGHLHKSISDVFANPGCRHTEGNFPFFLIGQMHIFHSPKHTSDQIQFITNCRPSHRRAKLPPTCTGFCW